MDLSRAEQILNYTFNDKNLLRRALTLSSFDGGFNNQKLEFFGDAILEFIVSERLYGDGAAKSSEGDLTKRRANIVCDNALKSVSERLGLDKILIKGLGDTNNQKAVPSAYEAVVGAIYSDGGMEAAKKFVYSTLDWNYAQTNYKGELQELLPRAELEYVTVNIGTPQKPEFECELTVNGEKFVGSAFSAQQAEKNAAQAALERLKKQSSNI